MREAGLYPTHSMQTRVQVYIRRNKLLKKLGFDSYQQFLASDKWREMKKTQYQDYVNGKACCFCGSNEEVHLHHAKYKKGNLDRAKVSGTLPVCAVCHLGIHTIEKMLDIDTNRATIVFNIVYFPEQKQFTWEQVKTAPDTRVFSMRIVPASRLPEVLHHSVNCYLFSWPELTPEQITNKYIELKRLRRDEKLVTLARQYYQEILSYIENRLTFDRPTSSV